MAPLIYGICQKGLYKMAYANVKDLEQSDQGIHCLLFHQVIT